ncbi:MAG: hypothetical protein ACRD0J_09035 [Acidimicrobiales bacterium]
MIPTKICCRCRATLAATTNHFYRDKAKPDGLSPHCKACHGAGRPPAETELAPWSATQTCRRCRQELPRDPDHFYRDASYAGGLRLTCKVCHDAAVAAAAARRRAKVGRVDTTPKKVLNVGTPGVIRREPFPFPPHPGPGTSPKAKALARFLSAHRAEIEHRASWALWGESPGQRNARILAETVAANRTHYLHLIDDENRRADTPATWTNISRHSA